MGEAASGPGAEALAEVLGAVAAALRVGDARVEVHEVEEGGLLGHVHGEGVDALVGRDGETIDALQYLCSQIVSRAEGTRRRVTIDAGDYRAQRRDRLERLARRAAEEALEHGDEIELDPMTPHDRRIIHMVLKEYEGISTRSEGEEPNRRIIVEPAD
ncbi:MAG: R3H domain-containing nucleic acid-binding protein [Actinomycetota bacterium]